MHLRLGRARGVAGVGWGGGGISAMRRRDRFATRRTCLDIIASQRAASPPRHAHHNQPTPHPATPSPHPTPHPCHAPPHSDLAQGRRWQRIPSRPWPLSIFAQLSIPRPGLHCLPFHMRAHRPSLALHPALRVTALQPWLQPVMLPVSQPPVWYRNKLFTKKEGDHGVVNQLTWLTDHQHLLHPSNSGCWAAPIRSISSRWQFTTSTSQWRDETAVCWA